MLWRALKDVTGGFFIDVGAWSPSADSVTRAFVDRGWSGINIEPTAEAYQQFVAERPTDVNLNLALDARSGEADLFVVAGRDGLSTLDAREAEARRRDGYTVERRRVQVTTLADVWDRHVPQGQEVHFLKVDVEGYERPVIEGGAWDRHRPWIVVVEATRPNSSIPAHEDWEGILTGAGYAFAYGDGLNRFYVSPAHPELSSSFGVPPNVFDGFVLAREAAALELAARAERDAASARAQLAAMRRSASWRFTGPLRATARTIRRFLRRLRARGQKPRGGPDG